MRTAPEWGLFLTRNQQAVSLRPFLIENLAWVIVKPYVPSLIAVRREYSGTLSRV
jgi:hypothetical protein